MRIGIISDTHDRLARTIAAIQMLGDAGAEAIIHCGDITGKEIVQACGALPSYFVFGNNDADNIPSLRRAMNNVEAVCLEWGDEVELAGKRVAVTHGHMATDVRRLVAQRPDYLLSGHTHHPMDTRDSGMHRINPGALHRATTYTVALLDLETDEVQFLTIDDRGRS